MNNLSKNDIHFVVSRLPKDIRELMQKDQVFLGGGFLRATIAGEKPSDIDLFGPSEEILDNCANKLVANRPGARKIHTKNAITIYQSPRLPVQFITRWVFDDPVRLAESFDFTIAQAVIYYNRTPVQGGTRWLSWTAEDFYADLAARRLAYTRPKRNEDAGGSLMRVRKFLGRGYNIQVAGAGGRSGPFGLRRRCRPCGREGRSSHQPGARGPAAGGRSADHHRQRADHRRGRGRGFRRGGLTGLGREA